nr:V-type proton ATPase catalytic subunit A [Ipomoea batatas]
MTILFFLSNGEIIQLEGDSATIQGSYLNSEQRLLKTIAIKSGDSVPALDKDILWEFQPKKLDSLLQVLETGGDLYADTVLELEFQGVKKQYTMLQIMLMLSSLCTCRLGLYVLPGLLQKKLTADTPLLTGQCVLDALFPSVLGGTCAIPGACWL